MKPYTEFDEGVDYVLNRLNLTPNGYVNFFEVTIRVLGGLLSAYHLSGDGRLLTKVKTFSTLLKLTHSPGGRVGYRSISCLRQSLANTVQRCQSANAQRQSASVDSGQQFI